MKELAGSGEDAPVVLTDPRAMRALAHPARLAVIEEIFAGRELTATECAEIVGLSPSAMSYHLRSLERAGIVRRAESAADGRERPWRAAGAYLEVKTDGAPGSAAGALTATVTDRLATQFAAWIARSRTEDPAWRDAAGVSSGLVWATREELERISEVVEPLMAGLRRRRAGERPPGARRVRLAVFAFPVDAPAAGGATAGAAPHTADVGVESSVPSWGDRDDQSAAAPHR